MILWAIAFAATAGSFLVLDLIWLGIMAPLFYRPALGDLLAERFNLRAAGVFYVAYVIGILVLAERSGFAEHSRVTAGVLGGVLGFVAYGTYDLTNLATLRRWPVKLAVVDLIWGTLVTAAASVVGCWAAGGFAA